jgi:hypothetical protein
VYLNEYEFGVYTCWYSFQEVRNALQLFFLPSNIKSCKLFTSWSSLWTDVFYLYHIVIIQFVVFYINKTLNTDKIVLALQYDLYTDQYNKNQIGWLITLYKMGPGQVMLLYTSSLYFILICFSEVQSNL